jgi:hypothetical protein
MNNLIKFGQIDIIIFMFNFFYIFINKKNMISQQLKEERKLIKQKLFTIRRSVEGEFVKLNSELRELKKTYESLPGFTSWSDFPEKWDIGDPYSVKKGAYAFNEIDSNNFKKAFGKPYETIVHKTVEEKNDEEEQILKPNN